MVCTTVTVGTSGAAMRTSKFCVTLAAGLPTASLRLTVMA